MSFLDSLTLTGSATASDPLTLVLQLLSATATRAFLPLEAAQISARWQQAIRLLRSLPPDLQFHLRSIAFDESLIQSPRAEMSPHSGYFSAPTSPSATKSSPPTLLSPPSPSSGLSQKSSTRGFRVGSPEAAGQCMAPLAGFKSLDSAKGRDWRNFELYLASFSPPLPLSRCTAQHVLGYLRYLDDLSRSNTVHLPGCGMHYDAQFASASGLEDTFFDNLICSCPSWESWQSGPIDSLVHQLRIAYKQHSHVSARYNPFDSPTVTAYLQDLRRRSPLYVASNGNCNFNGSPAEPRKRKWLGGPDYL